MAAPAQLPSYQLSSELVGHTGDVRCVAAVGSAVLSASRDQTTKKWDMVEPNVYANTQTYAGHSRYVLSVAYSDPTPDFPNGLIATGSLDTMINVYEPTLEAPLKQLSGHVQAVCCLFFVSRNRLLSSSWDFTGRVWDLDTSSCQRVLEGHAASATCIAYSYVHKLIITGSADRTIKLWDERACKVTCTGHEDAVRALAVLNDATFASASNDNMIRLWGFQGECLHAIHAHSHYIYSLCAIPNDRNDLEFASSGEDGCVKVWRNMLCVQTIALPCTSVWTLASKHNGDLIVGSDDSLVRVFTRTPDRMAREDTLSAFASTLAAHVAAKEQSKIGDMDKEELPGREALETPGRAHGVHKVVRHGGKAETYMWNAEKSMWEYVGEVTNAIEDANVTVFSVELDGQTWKIRHRHGDNPYMTAQK